MTVNPNARFISAARSLGVRGAVSFAKASGGRVSTDEARALWRGAEPGARKAARFVSALRVVNNMARRLGLDTLPADDISVDRLWGVSEGNIVLPNDACKQGMELPSC